MSETERKQTRVNCDIMLNKVESGIMNICRATNISLGGMRIQRMLEPFEAREERLMLELALPGEPNPIQIGAKKIYDGEDHFGVRFTDISHRHFVKLRGWIADQTLQTELPLFR